MAYRFVLLSISILTSLISKGQDCNSPISLCSNAPSSQTTADGFSVPNLSGVSCFTSENSIFFSFTTIDTSLVSGQVFGSGSEANIDIQNITCAGDSTFGNSISIAIFESTAATDLCDGSTYPIPELCIDSTSASSLYILDNLQPATTYYIMIDGDNNGLIVTNAAECSFDLNISGNSVEYNLNARPPIQTIIPGETAIFNSTEGFESYLWSGEALSSENTSNTSASPSTVDETYTYTLEAELDGCTYTDLLTVIVVPPIVVYNAFTPNGDGSNDTWYIQLIERYPDANIKVYSRWGQPVFSAIGYKNIKGWDGNGLPPATYYYVIELNPLNNETPPITGNVTIIY
jgi:gliding motility-associated-like protein